MHAWSGHIGGRRVLIVPTLEQATWREQAVVDERNVVPVDLDGDPFQATARSSATPPVPGSR